MTRTDSFGGTLVVLLAATLGGPVGCGADGAATKPLGPQAIEESPGVAARVAELRARFAEASEPRLRPASGPRGAWVEQAPPHAVIAESGATGFELRGDHVIAQIPSSARQGVARTASVTLPLRAGGAVRLEDDTSHVGVAFALRGANDAPAATGGGVAVYARAFAGADVVHRVGAEGTEDYVVFEQRPTEETLVYDLDVSRVAGLRLVGSALEFLDEGGAPRLRVNPPYAVDANGKRSDATLTVEGCAFDADPRAPWGRAVTAPGASTCALRASWRAASYPAIVDPTWTATGSMAKAREGHSSTLLGTGNYVLVAGGYPYVTHGELYHPGSGTFALTGQMAVTRAENTGTLVGGKVLVAGGDTCKPTPCVSWATAELYDPASGKFTLVASTMSSTRASHAAVLLPSGSVLLVGGFNTPEAPVAAADLYDPVTEVFTSTGSMNTARLGLTGTLLGSGSVLVAGGYGGPPIASAEIYDPVAGTFAYTGSLAVARGGHSATLLGTGKVLVAGGQNSGILSSAELYDPVAGTFATTAPMTAARCNLTATLLNTGKVLLAGGLTATAERFDPIASTFTATTPMNAARSSQAATLLPSGAVLVSGGFVSNIPQTSAELY